MDNIREKIIIIEADEASRTSLAAIMESGGYEVSAFSSSHEGLDVLQHAGADLLLLDVDLCGADMLMLCGLVIPIRSPVKLENA